MDQAPYNCLPLMLALLLTGSTEAQIVRWDNGHVISGTEGIVPGPGMDFTWWSGDGHNLRYADLSGALNLSDSRFFAAWVDNARFNDANLRGADFYAASLGDADFRGAEVSGANFERSKAFTKEQLYSTASYQAKSLTGVGFGLNDLSTWTFVGQNLSRASFTGATLANTNFSDAEVERTSFYGTTQLGFTREQLYSTASYKGGNLSGIGLMHNDLSNWNLSAQNLADADFWGTTLTNADFTDSWVNGADFQDTTSRGFTKEQLYSTASYKSKELRGLRLAYQNDLAEWNFAGQNLTDAAFQGSTLTGANFANSDVRGADFAAATSNGFVRNQLYSTASYRNGDLRRIVLAGNDLSAWDFTGQDLTGSYFGGASLGEANFTEAIIRETDFSGTTDQGFTKGQLYSTKSYREKDLAGVQLWGNDLGGWDFRGQNAEGAIFGCGGKACAFGGGAASLIDASLAEANLTGANLVLVDLTDADLSGALLLGANLLGANLTQADLRGANLTNAMFQDATLFGTDLRRTTGFVYEPHSGLRNAILPVSDSNQDAGEIRGLDVRSGETLSLTNNFHRPVIAGGDSFTRVSEFFSVAAGGTLQLHLAEFVDSKVLYFPATPIEVDPDATVSLHGALRLVLDGCDQRYEGMTIDVFDWPAPLAPGNAFDTIEVPAGTLWETSQLYTTGEVALLAIHAPGDVDGDGQIDLADFGLLRENFGRSNVNLLQGDLTGNSRIDLADFGLLKANFGKIAGAAAVPEPDTLLLAAIGLMSLALVRRRWV